MFYLNTTRHLITPPSDETIKNLLQRLDSGIVDKAGSVPGMRSISWMISTDRLTVQAFSGWDTAEDLPRAEHSSQHVENSKLLVDLLGGVTEPQTDSYYEFLYTRKFD